MKKIMLIATTVLTMLIIAPTQSVASNSKTTPANTMAEAEVKLLVNRLEEIKNMDKSDLNSTEKKELRKEVRSIKENLKENSGGVYLSVGALLLVIILLILLL